MGERLQVPCGYHCLGLGDRKRYVEKLLVQVYIVTLIPSVVTFSSIYESLAQALLIFSVGFGHISEVPRKYLGLSLVGSEDLRL